MKQVHGGTYIHYQADGHIGTLPQYAGYRQSKLIVR